MQAELIQKGFLVASGVQSLDANVDLIYYSPDALDTPIEFEDSPTLGLIRGKTLTDGIEPLDGRFPVHHNTRLSAALSS
ncbi:hypothetical protein SBOR_1332 [Sclerotinia borealis F-4128]|uniref:Uncharacterized protein n=1 Tax=Sclerotinia borealis (strain F-4128) TaxID=1432307 RepID=W9CQW6_SCLBF|nr:hypothetical protein SBOR_1332 [Sclerotinia borealis F-4128]